MQLTAVFEAGQLIRVAESEEKAKSGLAGAEYLLVPVVSGMQYEAGYFSEGAPGAVIYRPESDSMTARIEKLETENAGLKSRIDDLEAAADLAGQVKV